MARDFQVFSQVGGFRGVHEYPEEATPAHLQDAWNVDFRDGFIARRAGDQVINIAATNMTDPVNGLFVWKRRDNWTTLLAGADVKDQTATDYGGYLYFWRPERETFQYANWPDEFGSLDTTTISPKDANYAAANGVPNRLETGPDAYWRFAAMNALQDVVYCTNGYTPLQEFSGFPMLVNWASGATVARHRIFCRTVTARNRNSTTGLTYLGAVPTVKYLAVFQQRLVALSDKTVPDRMYFSDVAFPDAFSTAAQVDVVTQENDPITGAAVLLDRLIVFKRYSIHAVLDVDTANNSVTVVKLVDGVGCIAPNSIAVIPGGIIFLGQDGVYLFDGSTPRKVSRPVEATVNGYPMYGGLLSDRLRSIADPLNRSSAVGAVLYARNQYWLAMPSRGAGQARLVLVWDYASDRWTKWGSTAQATTAGPPRTINNPALGEEGFHVSSLASSRPEGGEERMYFGDILGNVHEWPRAHGDGRRPIIRSLLTVTPGGTTQAATEATSYMRSSWLSRPIGMDDMTIKVARYIRFQAVANSTDDIDVNYLVDGEDTVTGDARATTTDFTETNNAYYGAGVLGTATFRTEKVKDYRIDCADTAVGRTITVGMEADSSPEAPYIVRGFQVEYEPRARR